MKNIFYLFGLLFLACGDKEPSEPEIDSDDLCIVTGINFFDEQGAPVGKAGNPNTNARDAQLFLYPNPGNGIVNIGSLDLQGKNIWIVPAEKNIDFGTFDFVQNTATHTIDEVETKQIQQIEWIGSNNTISIDLSALSKGYYRVFFESEDGQFRWENIYLDNSLSGNEIVEFLLTEW